MIRVFIAAEIPGRIRDALSRDMLFLKSGAPLVKWVKPDNLHLTFRFLGDVKETDLEELFDALADSVSSLPAFSLQIRGIGAFPNWRHPRVVWAGCDEGADDAVALAAAVESACVDLGYEKEKRPFRPHLTLGRVKQPSDAAGLEAIADSFRDKEFGYVDIDAIAVFMSTLRRTGPVYSPMAHIPLC